MIFHLLLNGKSLVERSAHLKGNNNLSNIILGTMKMLNVDIYYSIVKSKDELFNWRIEMERSKIENCIFIDLRKGGFE